MSSMASRSRMRQNNGRVVDRAVMDYIIVPRNIKEQLLDVRVLRGEVGGMSDHFLVKGKLRVFMKQLKAI